MCQDLDTANFQDAFDEHRISALAAATNTAPRTGCSTAVNSRPQTTLESNEKKHKVLCSITVSVFVGFAVSAAQNIAYTEFSGCVLKEKAEKWTKQDWVWQLRALETEYTTW